MNFNKRDFNEVLRMAKTLDYSPIQFSVYQFDESLSLPEKFNKLFAMFVKLAENNQTIIDYLEDFYNKFDEHLYDTVEKILEKWLEDGTLAGLIDGAILRFRDVFINVKDFGAKGDGITDDTEALEKAFKYANEKRGRIYFPVGVYPIRRTLRVNQHGVSVYGVSANWSESCETYGSTIIALDCFVGEELVRFEHETSAYLRSVSMHNITLRGGETSKCHGFVGVMLYDHIRFTNVQIDMIHGDYHSWYVTAKNTNKQQTHIYEGCIGSKRSHINSKETCLFENMQETVFINCKFWNSLETTSLGTANVISLINCGAVTFETCSFVSTSQNAVYIADGKVGGGDSLTFQNCLFEECQSAFKIEVKTIKMFGTMDKTVPVGSKVFQGENSGLVSLSTLNGIYLYDIDGIFTTGEVFDSANELIGVVAKTEYTEISNLRNVHPKNTYSRLTKMKYHIANLKNSFIQTGVPVLDSETLDIKIFSSTKDSRIEIPKKVSFVNESPTTKVVFLSGQEFLFNLSSSNLNYLIKAVTDSEISVSNPFDSEINITVFSGDTIDGEFTTLFLPANETIRFKASSNTNWNVLTFENSYYLFNPTGSKGRGVNRSTIPIKSLVATGSTQIGRLAITNSYISSGTYTSFNLPASNQFQGTPFLFITGNASTVDIVPRTGERFRGKPVNEKLTFNSEGKTIQLISYESGVWDILKMV